MNDGQGRAPDAGIRLVAAGDGAQRWQQLRNHLQRSTGDKQRQDLRGSEGRLRVSQNACCPVGEPETYLGPDLTGA